MNAIILSIGDELVLGQTIDTNSAWISQQLSAIGCDIVGHQTVPDDQKLIEQAIQETASRCDVLVISGGIGPTQDDLTRQALSKVMNEELEMDEAWLHRLRAFFRARSREMPETNKIQAMIPTGATIIENSCGTAAGIRAVISHNDHVCQIFVTPGVPKEMKAMFNGDVLPHIQQAAGGACILSRTLHTFGLGESSVAEMLGDLMKRDRNPSVGTTVSGGMVSLRLNVRATSREIAQQQLEATDAACRAALGDLIFGQDEDTLPSAVAHLLKNSALSTHHSALTVTTAESCTGGLLAKFLTDIPGSSGYFKSGFITYSNESKHERLGVPIELIEQHGAVSEPVVIAMADGARNLAKADIALSISGIAGPDGGTSQKPVGTVCIALSDHGKTSARTFNFPGDREMIRDRAAKMAMTMLRYHLMNRPLPF